MNYYRFLFSASRFTWENDFIFKYATAQRERKRRRKMSLWVQAFKWDTIQLLARDTEMRYISLPLDSFFF